MKIQKYNFHAYMIFFLKKNLTVVVWQISIWNIKESKRNFLFMHRTPITAQ